MVAKLAVLIPEDRLVIELHVDCLLLSLSSQTLNEASLLCMDSIRLSTSATSPATSVEATFSKAEPGDTIFWPALGGGGADLRNSRWCRRSAIRAASIESRR